MTIRLIQKRDCCRLRKEIYNNFYQAYFSLIKSKTLHKLNLIAFIIAKSIASLLKIKFFNILLENIEIFI